MFSALRRAHYWLTNRRNIPTAINTAIRIPTTNETTQCRSTGGFDPAPFCAAPRPNQKRSLSIVVSAVTGASLWRPYYAYDCGELPHSASAKSPIRARDTSLDGTTNGSAGVNRAPDVNAGANGAPDLGG